MAVSSKQRDHLVKGSCTALFRLTRVSKSEGSWRKNEEDEYEDRRQESKGGRVPSNYRRCSRKQAQSL